MVVLWDPPEEADTRRAGYVVPVLRAAEPGFAVAGTGGALGGGSAAAFGGGVRLEVMRPLTAELGSRRCTLRYLPPQGGHPGAMIIGAEAEDQPGEASRRSA